MLDQAFISQEQENQFFPHPKSNRLRRKILIILFVVVITGIGIYSFMTILQPDERSIAVLPLHNLTGQVENNYFVDGMHDALIGELGQIGSLRVISRTSTLRYRDSQLLLKDIAHELGVNTIVEGSILGASVSFVFLFSSADRCVSKRTSHFCDKVS